MQKALSCCALHCMRICFNKARAYPTPVSHVHVWCMYESHTYHKVAE
jgi:hypothetical protein